MDQEGIDARNRSQDVAERILERHERARGYVDRLYKALEDIYSEHGACGCVFCKGAEMALFDTRNQYKLPDNMKRSGFRAVYRRVLISTPEDEGRG